MKKINDDKIEKYINELGEEYKELLFDALLRKSDSMEDLSVSELLRIDTDVKKYLQRKEDSNKNTKFLLLGIGYIFFGVFMYLFSEIMLKFYDLRHISPAGLIQVMSVIIGLVGVIACFFSFIRQTKGNKTFEKDSEKSENIKLLEYEIISTWRELEGISNDIALKNDVIANKSVIQLLLSENLISEDERIFLTHFLKLRNSIVHDDKVGLSVQELRNEINQVNMMIEKINSKLLPKSK